MTSRNNLIETNLFIGLCVGFLTVVPLLVIPTSISQAQVILDGTLGGSTPGQRVGPGTLPNGKVLSSGASTTDHLITHDLGLRKGNNLFHSFSDFNIDAGKSATFTGPDSIANVLSRVTGGNVSNINGTLASTMDNANLFLLNPAGLIFGPNAILDVKGAFSASTADFIQLGQDGVFYSNLEENSVLTTAALEAFGFLGTNPPTIATTGSAGIFVEGLESSNQRSVSLVSRDAMAGEKVVEGIAISGGTLKNPNGPVNLVSIGGAQLPVVDRVSVDINTLKIQGIGSQDEVVQDPVQFGGILLSQQAQIDTSGDRGGPVVIRGGQLTLDGSSISVNATGPTEGSTDEPWTAVDVKADSLFLRDGASIGAETSSSADGGDIILSVNKSLEIRDGSFVFTSATAGSGNAGEIEIHADKVEISGGFTGISSDSSTNGNGGNIRLHTNLLEMDAGLIQNLTSGPGNAGNIDVFVRQGKLADIPGQGETPSFALEITDSASITNQSFESSSGDAGEIQVKVGEEVDNGTDLTFEGGDVLIDGSAIFSQTAGTGKGGKIQFTAGNLEMVNSEIQIQNFTLDQTPGSVALTLTDSLSLDEGSTINTEVRNSAAGAPLSITAKKDINITDSSTVSTSTRGDGPGGNLNIVAENLQVTDQGTITSEARSFSTDPLIRSGNAGNIDIDLTGNLLLTREGQIAVSTITAGDGGNINVSATNLSLTDGASITAESASLTNEAGNAGNVTLEGRDSILVDQSTVTTRAENALGGNIKLTAPNLIQVANSEITSNVREGSADAGTINIDPEFIVVQNSEINSSADIGNGGDVTFVASSAILFDSLSTIDTTSRFGGNGIVDIQAPIQNLSGTIAPLPEEAAPVTALYAARCAAGQGGHFSTFVDSKADSLSPMPGAFLSSPLLISSNPTHPVADASRAQGDSIILTAAIAPLVLGHAGESTTACP